MTEERWSSRFISTLKSRRSTRYGCILCFFGASCWCCCTVFSLWEYYFWTEKCTSCSLHMFSSSTMMNQMPVKEEIAYVFVFNRRGAAGSVIQPFSAAFKAEISLIRVETPFQLLLILGKEYWQKAGSDYYNLPTAVEASASFQVTAAAGKTSVDAAVGAALMMTFCFCFCFSYLLLASNLDPGSLLLSDLTGRKKSDLSNLNVMARQGRPITFQDFSKRASPF